MLPVDIFSHVLRVTLILSKCGHFKGTCGLGIVPEGQETDSENAHMLTTDNGMAPNDVVGLFYSQPLHMLFFTKNGTLYGNPIPHVEPETFRAGVLLLPGSEVTVNMAGDYSYDVASVCTALRLTSPEVNCFIKRFVFNLWHLLDLSGGIPACVQKMIDLPISCFSAIFEKVVPVKRMVLGRFPDCLEAAEMSTDYDLRKSIAYFPFVRRLAEIADIEFCPQVFERAKTNELMLAESDIIELKVGVRRTCITDYATGRHLLARAAGYSHPQQVRTLLLDAVRSLLSAVTSSPMSNPLFFYHLGQAYQRLMESCQHYWSRFGRRRGKASAGLLGRVCQVVRQSYFRTRAKQPNK